MKLPHASLQKAKNILAKLPHKRIVLPVAALIVVASFTATAIALQGSPEDKVVTKNTTKESKTGTLAATDEAKHEAEANTDPSADNSSTKPTTGNSQSKPKSSGSSSTPSNPQPERPQNTNIKITRNHQLPAGTLISYNSAKDEYGYYGGTLVLNSYDVTVSRSNALPDTDLLVSTPDGELVSMPHQPWDDTNPHMALASNEPSGYDTDFGMFVDAWPTTPLGTHTLHITAVRTDANMSWYYHAFITVHVVD